MRQAAPPLHRRRARGVAAVPVVMLLFLGLGIMSLYANRGLIFEQRTAANQARATQAFETAEAGLEWAASLLNATGGIGSDCEPDSASSQTFRDRFLVFDTSTGLITPRPDSANAGQTLRAACVLTASGLRCNCPASGVPSPAATDVGETFLVTFEAPNPARAGVVRLSVTGCTSTGSADHDPQCVPGGSGRADARARVTALHALLPLLGTAPSAPVTLVGSVTWQGTGAAVGVFNTDAASQGLTIQAGGSVDASKARITSMPGTPAAQSIVANDPSLAALTPQALFASLFSMGKDAWRALATEVACSGDCSGALESAIAAGARAIWVEGDLELQGNAQIGSVGSPVVLVVNGAARLRGTTQVVGLVYAADWDNTGGGSALLRGAAVSESGFSANGTPDFYYDATVMQQLSQGGAGFFVRLPGSWRDF